MKIIGLFNKYFVILMVIQGLVLIFVDSKSFNKANMRDIGAKAKFIGIGSIIISISLYFISTFTV